MFLFRHATKAAPRPLEPAPETEPSLPEAASEPSPPFDPSWYARHQLDPEAAPQDDYLAGGAEAGRSPCPFFAPAWYRARYPDVALAGEEPLAHWLRHGWREGRDPSALFATAAYLEAHPELVDGATDPLTHYLAEGRSAGARIHPVIAAPDPAKPDLGLVMIYEGDDAALELALWALDQGRGGLPITVYLVDDGCEPARAALDALAAAQSRDGFHLRRHSETLEAGFAARAAAGLWLARQDRNHSHIGLLSQSVLVPRGVLAGLIDLWAPIAAPVLNIAGTEQRIPTDFDIYSSAAPLETLNAFLARRNKVIPGAVEAVGKLSPSCVLFAAGALAALGPLDRGAAPEDVLAGALQAVKDAGTGAPVVARHLYAHALERSPVFVDAPPILALPALRSAEADRRALRRWDGHAATLLAAHAECVAAAEARALCDPGGTPEPSVPDALACVAAGDQPRPIAIVDPPELRRAYRRIQLELLRQLIDRDLTGFDQARALQPLARALAPLFADGPPVLVLTMDTDPVTGDEKDGYVQRVVAIDKALTAQHRIYLKIVSARVGRPALVCLAARLWRLEIAPADPLGETVLAVVLRLGASVYSQSLVGIDPPMVRKLLPQRTGSFILDMHGAVPEEFVLYENHYMAQKYARYERWAADRADTVVCVTEAMAEHFAAKLGIDRRRSIVCPIFVHQDADAVPVRPYALRPRAVYAGGTQRWQCIPDLAATVAATSATCDWSLLTPDTDGMAAALERTGVALDTPGLSLRSASQREVFDTYLRCDFGLLLREDSVVNRVACPTKLVEYLRFGVVPVLQTPHVGDFAAMGMRFVSAQDFCEGRLPSPDQRAEMARENHRLFQRLLAASRAGLAQIATAARGGQPAMSQVRSTA